MLPPNLDNYCCIFARSNQKDGIIGKNKRFTVDYKNGLGLASSAIVIIDNETGVNYLFVNSGYAGGLTPLLDSKGNVIITR